MKRAIISAILFLVCTAVFAQKDAHILPAAEYDKDLKIGRKCFVYQSLGDYPSDSSLVLVSEYYKNGKLASEIYTGYKESAEISTGDCRILYLYKDTLLSVRYIYDADGDSSAAFYYYNDRKQLVKEMHFRATRQFHDSFKRRGCVVFDSDYNHYRTWKPQSTIYYTYDSAGRLAEYYAPEIHWDSQNRYTWSYDEAGQIKKYCSYYHNSLIWEKVFLYHLPSSYEYVNTWYDYEGNPRHLKERDYEYYYQMHRTYILDKKGRVVEESLRSEKNEFLGKIMNSYNRDGTLSASKTYNRSNNLSVMHIYRWRRVK